MKQLTSKLLTVLLLFLIIGNVSAQDPGDKEIQFSNFDENLLRKLVKEKVNELRAQGEGGELMYHQLFEDAAQAQAEWMKTNRRADILQTEDADMGTTADRISAFGGTSNQFVAENVIAAKLARGKTLFTYKKVAEDIIDDWKKKTDSRKNINEPAYIYTGIGIGVDESQKKVYVSQVFTTGKSLNEGAQYRNELPVKYSKNQAGLLPYSDAECADVQSFNFFNDLQKGLTVEDGVVYLKYNNVNHLKDFFINPKDGIAVDLVQRAQYPCEKANIYDNNLDIKGKLLRGSFFTRLFSGLLYRNKIFKKNKGEGEEVNIKIKKLPGKLTEEYELNLVVIKNKHICKIVTPSFTEFADPKTMSNLEVIPDTIEVLPDTLLGPGQERYKVGIEKKTLTFKIPFEYSKYNYKPEDIQPFIEALDEPHFIIDEVRIYAHSSMEGDSTINAILREKRAQSIVDAMAKYQRRDVDSEIVYDDSWNMFRKQVMGTEFEELASKTKKDVKTVLATDRKIRTNIEPLLAEERFAKIIMKVTVDDIQGMAEDKYLNKKISQAVAEDDPDAALKAQRFMIEKVLEGEFGPDVIMEKKYPREEKYASLLVNQAWAKNKFVDENNISPELVEEMKALYEMAPGNPYVQYNRILVMLRSEQYKSESDIDSVQNKIDGLYSAVIPEMFVDMLNIENQIMVLDWLEKNKKLDRIKLTKAIARIKKSYNAEYVNWQTALKIAIIFSKHQYYKDALEVLEPFVDEIEANKGKEGEEVNKDLLFTYIVLSSMRNEVTGRFRKALDMAKDVNKDRYCKLFGTPYLSFQLLDDPKIKETYCKSCK